MDNLELNKIYCENNLDTMARMPDNLVDLTVTSPPYNTGGYSLNKSVDRYYKDYDDDLSPEEYSEFIHTVTRELLRVTKHYVFFNFQVLSGNKLFYIEWMHKYRHNLKDIFIWKKQAVAQIQKGKMATGFEFVVILGKDDSMIFDYNNFPENSYVPNIKEFNKKDRIEGHGATFTVEMVSYFVCQFSKDGDLIYDPFMGSGTTAVSCAKNNRRFIGSEISQEYVDLANKRLDPYLRQERLAL